MIIEYTYKKHLFGIAVINESNRVDVSEICTLEEWHQGEQHDHI